MKKKTGLLLTLAGCAAVTCAVAFGAKGMEQTLKSIATDVATQTITFDCNSLIQNGDFLEATKGGNKVGISLKDEGFTDGGEDGYLDKKASTDNNYWIYSFADETKGIYNYKKILSVTVEFDNLSVGKVSDGNEWFKIGFHPFNWSDSYGIYQKDIVSGTTYQPSDFDHYSESTDYTCFAIQAYGHWEINFTSITVVFSC